MLIKLTLCSQFLFLVATCIQNNSSVSYDGFQVYRIIPQTTEQLQTLQKLEAESNNYDFWTPAVGMGHPVDIMVAPYLKHNFQNFIEFQNLDAEVWIENIQERIDMEQIPLGKKSKTFNWNDYYSLEMINAWLDSLTKKYQGIATTVIGGRSYEGRDIRGVKVSFGPEKKGAFLEGGIHAREWISPATVTYILNELITSTDPSVRAVAESRDWYVFPVTNPDGYAYTHSHHTRRMWRKTRKPYGSCYGADPNRNWNYRWGNGGTSNNPCADIYHGSSAFSEIETKSLSNYISSIAKQLDAYIAFHSYSQLLMLPFGHQGYEVPENNNELMRIGKTVINKLATRYGTQYRIGNIPNLVGVASGSSVDWVRGVYRHIRLAYAYELRDGGRHGFILPKEQIKPSGEETLDSLIAMFQEADAISSNHQ